MTENREQQIRILTCEPAGSRTCGIFSAGAARESLRFHRSVPGYRETPLISLEETAKHYHTGSILVKDESARFGLNAFKGLGGSYCMFRILCSLLSLDPETADYRVFLDPEIRERVSGTEFVTATDGNHGKGVSWAAKLFGCRAHVFLPKGSAEVRRRAIEEAGSAEAVITEENYDQTVRYAASLAEKNGWILIQDTSWEGYEQIPEWIIQGYLTLAAETEKQMGGKDPTHLFLQAGVGAMAGGIEAYFMSRPGRPRPLVTVVEPEEADCLYRSALAEDGKIRSVEGDPVTIMAGLNCGTPCGAVWPVLRDGTSFFCACPDAVAEEGMRAFALPREGDPAIVSGESGAVTYGLLLRILESELMRKQFRIGEDSVILLVSTEGAGDPEAYAAVTGKTPEEVK